MKPVFLFAGEWILFLFVGLFVAAIPVAIGAFVVYAFRARKRLRASWESAATMLGLTISAAPNLSLSGRFADHDVTVHAGSRRSGDATEIFTCCRTPLKRKLRWLLDLRAPQNILDNLFTPNADLRIGIAAFDDAFVARCYEAEVLRRVLLTDFPTAETRNLAEDLILAQKAFPTIRVTDTEVYVEIRGHLGNTAQIRSLIEATIRLASRFDSVRALFPPSDWEQKLGSEWLDYARRNGLRFDPENMTIDGRVGRFSVAIAMETGKGRWQTRIDANFPTALDGGLKAMPSSMLHSALEWLGAQDIQTGHRAFDELFVVKADDGAAARRILHFDLCGHLVDLRRGVGEVTITPTSISVVADRLIGDPNDLQKTIADVLSAAAALSSR